MAGNPLEVIDPNGMVRVEPSVVAKFNLQTRAPVAAPTNNDALILAAFKGGPKDLLKQFTTTATLQKWHDPLGWARGEVSDAGCRYGQRIFDPSPDVNGAASIYTVRVGDPTQSTATMQSTMKDSGGDYGPGQGFALTTADYGAQTVYTQQKFSLPTNSDVNAVGGSKFIVKQYAGTPGEISREMDNLGLPMYLRADTAMGTAVTAQVQVASTQGKIHQAHDTANVTTPPDAVDLVTAQVLALAFKTDFNVHIASAVFHYAADTGAGITAGAAPGWVEADLQTFLTDAQTQYNAHLTRINVVHIHQYGTSGTDDPIAGRVAATTATATLAAKLQRLNDIVRAYNSHTRGYSTNETAQLYIAVTNPGAGYPASVAVDFTQAQYDTIGDVVTALNAVPGLHAKIFPGVDTSMPSKYLDVMDTAVSIRSATAFLSLTALAHHPVWEIQNKCGDIYSSVSLYDGWFGYGTDKNGYEINSTYTTCQGGVDDTSLSTQDYQDALDIVGAAGMDVISGGMVFVDTTDTAVRSAVQTWIRQEEQLRSRYWRVVFGSPSPATGGLSLGVIPTGTTSYRYVPTDAEESAIEADLVLVDATTAGVACDRIIDRDQNGNDTLYGTLDLAAIMTGMSAGARRTQVLSGKAIRCITTYDQPNTNQRESRLKAGAPSLQVVSGRATINMMVTTRQSMKRMERMWSEVAASVYLKKRMYFAIRPLVPTWGGLELVSKARDTAKEVLHQETVPTSDGVALLSAGYDGSGNRLPPYDNVAATLLSGVLRCTATAYIAGEVDHGFFEGNMEYQTFGVDIPV